MSIFGLSLLREAIEKLPKPYHESTCGKRCGACFSANFVDLFYYEPVTTIQSNFA